MSEKICSTYYKKEVFEMLQKTYQFSKNTDFWNKTFPEKVFHLIFFQLWKTDNRCHKLRLYNEYFAKNRMKIEFLDLEILRCKPGPLLSGPRCMKNIICI
jgi:hypothetical protein